MNFLRFLLCWAGVLATIGLWAEPFPETGFDTSFWKAHESQFQPGAEGKSATLTFPAGKWSALLGTGKIPDGFRGTMEISAKCRMTGDYAQAKHTSLHLAFYDANRKEIKMGQSPANTAVISPRGDAQEILLLSPIPDGAKSFRCDFSSHGGAVLVIDSFGIELNQSDLSPEEEAKRILVADFHSLKLAHVWSAHNTTFERPSGKNPGKLVFPSGKWSALLGTFPLDQSYRGKVRVHAEVRLVGDYTALKHTAVSLMFIDANAKSIPLKESTENNYAIKRTGDWQSVDFLCPVPEGATRLRVDFSSHGGGTLEIRDIEITLPAVNVTESAVLNVNLPGAKLPTRSAGKVSADAAEAEVFEAVPFDLAAPFWGERPAYRIAATESNKSPRIANDSEASFQLAADRESLYVLFRALDDKLDFKDETTYLRDCFEFFLMPTGKYRNPKCSLRKEQYTVTRDENGETVSNVPAKTRLIPGGWEALIQVPLQTDVRRIYPFTGLELTFNAAYQDADSVGQEHWLSFSAADRHNESWRNPELYVPVTFVSQLELPYRPLWLGDAAEYNVAPNFPGNINAIEFPAAVENLGFWEGWPEADIRVKDNAYQIRYADGASRDVRVQLPMFSVLPGEVWEWEYEAKTDVSDGIAPIGGGFVAQANWEGFPFKMISGPSRIGGEWSRFKFQGTVPERIRNNMRSGRLLTNWGCHPGKTLFLRNFSLKRRTPVDFDAKLSLDRFYSHWFPALPNQAFLRWATPKAQKLEIEFELQDYFSGKSAGKIARELDAAPGEGKIDVTFPADVPFGFYNLKAKIRDGEGKFLADRELYIANIRPAPKLNRTGGIFIHDLPELTPPQKLGPMAEAFAQLGEGGIAIMNFRLFDSNNHLNPIALEKLRELAEFKKRGISIDTKFARGNGSYMPHHQIRPAESFRYFEQMLNVIPPGIVDFYHFENEPNLWCDAREWAATEPVLHQAVKKLAPDSKVILGNFNRIPVEYLKEVHRQLGRNFADGIIGVHLYGVEFNGNGFDELLKARTEYEKLYPGWEVRDMESGSVHHTFPYLAEMISKKMPIHLSAGVAQTLFYNDRDFMLPYADATPHVALEAFKNAFYNDVEPLGRAKLADGTVHVYFFRRPDGTYCAALWNTQVGKVSFPLPGSARATRFDQFGNEIRRTSSGDWDLVLADRFVNYFEGLDFAPFQKMANFLPAFRPSRTTPQIGEPGVTQEVYVVPEIITGNFDHYLAPGGMLELPVWYCNASDSEKAVVPEGRGDRLTVNPSPAGTLSLAPGEWKKVTFSVSESGLADETSLAVGGNVGDRSLVPRHFAIKSAPRIAVTALSRTISVRNNSGRTLDVALTPNSAEFFFAPAQLDFNALKPGETRALPFTFSARTRPDAGQKVVCNLPQSYTIKVKSALGEFPVKGELCALAPEKFEATPDFSRLRYAVERDGLKLHYQLVDEGKFIRLMARVFDATPNQTRELGDIKHGGDVLLAAFDNGKNYREYGYALNGKTPQSYVWEGKYGLETARNASDTVLRMERTSGYYDVDVRLPRDNWKSGDGFSIRVVDRNADGKDHTLDLGGGIDPRAPHAMGVLK